MADINVGAISEALNNKADRDLNNTDVQSRLDNKANTNLNNIPSAYDYVVESQLPTSSNGYTWYRKYKSGWVEQGGICPSLGYTVTFPVVMADVNYTALGTARGTTGNYAIRVQDITTTGIKLNSSSSNQHEIWWQVSGMAA